MPISFRLFHKQLEQQIYALFDFNEDQEVIDFADKDQSSLIPIDVCGSYAFAPSFANDVMWQYQAKFSYVFFDELEFKNPYDK